MVKLIICLFFINCFTFEQNNPFFFDQDMTLKCFESVKKNIQTLCDLENSVVTDFSKEIVDKKVLFIELSVDFKTFRLKMRENKNIVADYGYFYDEIESIVEQGLEDNIYRVKSAIIDFMNEKGDLVMDYDFFFTFTDISLTDESFYPENIKQKVDEITALFKQILSDSPTINYYPIGFERYLVEKTFSEKPVDGVREIKFNHKELEILSYVDDFFLKKLNSDLKKIIISHENEQIKKNRTSETDMKKDLYILSIFRRLQKMFNYESCGSLRHQSKFFIQLWKLLSRAEDFKRIMLGSLLDKSEHLSVSEYPSENILPQELYEQMEVIANKEQGLDERDIDSIIKTFEILTTNIGVISRILKSNNKSKKNNLQAELLRKSLAYWNDWIQRYIRYLNDPSQADKEKEDSSKEFVLFSELRDACLSNIVAKINNCEPIPVHLLKGLEDYIFEPEDSSEE